MNGRPKLLDCFAGEGGAATGYDLAGWDVTCVELDPVKAARNPHRTIVADAITYAADHGRDYDAVTGSPVCKPFTDLAVLSDNEHPDTLTPFRAVVVALGVPYVIENVEGAPLRDPMWLCGSMFGLDVECRDGERRWLRRHRGFESNVFLVPPGPCMHPAGQPVGVYGTGGGGQQTRGYKAHPEEARAVMGMPWGSRDGVAQAIPPQYTRWIGAQLIDALEVAA